MNVNVPLKEWTKVVNRKIHQVREAKFLSEDQKLYNKEKKRKSAQESRMRKKTLATIATGMYIMKEIFRIFYCQHDDFDN